MAYRSNREKFGVFLFTTHAPEQMAKKRLIATHAKLKFPLTQIKHMEITISNPNKKRVSRSGFFQASRAAAAKPLPPSGHTGSSNVQPPDSLTPSEAGWYRAKSMLRNSRRYFLLLLAVLAIGFFFYKFRNSITLEGFHWSLVAESLREARISLLLLSMATIFACFALRALPIAIGCADTGLEVAREYVTSDVRDKIVNHQAIPTPEDTYELLWQQLRLDLDAHYG